MSFIFKTDFFVVESTNRIINGSIQSFLKQSSQHTFTAANWEKRNARGKLFPAVGHN